MVNVKILVKIKLIPYFWMLALNLIGCSGFNGPLRQYFSLYRAVSQKEVGVAGWCDGAG